MLIFLYGPDTFRSRQKLNQIIDKYRAKHKSGLNFLIIDFDDAEPSALKEIIKNKPMFAEKKLVVVKNFFNLKTIGQAEIVEYFKKSNLEKDREIIIVIYEKGAPDKRNQAFKFLTSKGVLSEEFENLEGGRLEAWIKKEIETRGGRIERGAAQELAGCLGGDLWRVNNEIEKLMAFKNGAEVKKEDIVVLVNAKIGADIFQTIDALARRDKKNALRLLHRHLKNGENEIYLLTMFVYQFRNLLMIKDLIERGVSYSDLASKTKLHPFVVKKSFQQIKNFSLKELKKIYGRLAESDLAVKTGKIEPRAVLEMLIVEI